MPRTINEQVVYKRSDLEQIAKTAAKMTIVGTFYRGDLGEQTASWNEDGSLTVVTTHTPAG